MIVVGREGPVPTGVSPDMQSEAAPGSGVREELKR